MMLDAYEAHWDPEALKIALDHHVHPVFLRSNASAEDQPLDNAFNCKLKSVYSNAFADYGLKYPVSAGNAFAPSDFNKVFAETYEAVMSCPRTSEMITYSFIKTGQLAAFTEGGVVV
jgi:hypothetical protein